MPPSTNSSPSRSPSAPERNTSTGYNHKIALLSSRYRPAGGVMLGGRARLYGDRIELDGWRLTGRFKQCIPLVRIIEMKYHALDAKGNLSLFLDDNTELHLVIQDAHLWRQSFEGWLNYHVLASAKIISERDQASAISG